MKTVSKKRCIWLFAGLATVCMGGALLAGCTGGGLSVDDVLENGYNCIVTFDTAGGQWSSGGGGNASSGEDGAEDAGTARMEERKYYVKSGSYLNEASAIEFAQAIRDGYTFNTYWTGEKNADGSVTYGKPWNFETDRVTESITLYARWMENYSLVAHYGENFSKSKTFTVPQDSNGVAQPLNRLSFVSEGITVIAMYENEDLTGEITEPYLAPCTAENKVHHIYVDSLEGSWTLVRKKSDFVIYQNSWLYLLADVDLENEEIDFPSVFTGRIDGNGHTVRNFTVTQEQGTRSQRYFGLFKEIRNITDENNEITESAQIKNITFENVTYTAMLTNPEVVEYSAGVFAGRVDPESVIENVKVTGTFNFVITTKGSPQTPNHYESIEEINAIGYQLQNADGSDADMSKYQADISGVTVNKYADELPKDPAEGESTSGDDQNNQ